MITPTNNGRLKASSPAPQPKRFMLRALAVWLLIALAESVHGTLRVIFLAPVAGDLASRQIGVFTGSIMILMIAWSTIRWVGTRTTTSLLGIGALWLVLMLSFEVALGRAFGMSWDRIASDYQPARGGFMVVGMIVLALSPLIAARLRSVRASVA